jgi:putative nucleotidyltransferase with HDIG domain
MGTHEELRALLPELSLIKDRALREQTLDVWGGALEESGWTTKDLEKIPFTLLFDTQVSILDHTRAVTRTAVAIADVLSEFYGDLLPINRDYLVSGGLLHDVGKLLEYTRKGKKIVKSEVGKDLRHPFSGTALAYKRGLPSAVCHLIAVHAKEGEGARRSTEAFIINHSDFVNFEPLKNR